MPTFQRDPSGAISIAPGLETDAAVTEAAATAFPPDEAPIGARTVRLAGIAILVGIAGGLCSWFLLRLIGLITNLVFFHRVAFDMVAPSDAHPGAWVIGIPIAGAIVIGFMARYGTAAIRGHGIPEVMEKVLHGESRIPMRVMFLKPISAAIAIGTGGPFGAEGPIIATGGAFGSLVGQLIRISSDERKVLLAAGAAAGMAATFGCPVAAVLLAIELLLFEYRARSIIPVALASAAATGVRFLLMGSAPVFAVPAFAQPSDPALVAYVVLGGIVGVAAAFTTRLVYAIEDGFEHLPIHWMWWPALGAVVVGVIGYIEPRTLGVGYQWIEAIIGGQIVGSALIAFVVLKLISWSIYLGSGTSGGTLAPLFIIGGGIGAVLGSLGAHAFPGLGIAVPIAALVGMAAIFAGASHALLASVVFAFETTRQPLGLLPLLGGCTASYLVMLLINRNSIMTERLARRGTPVHTEYELDFLARVPVRDVASSEPITLDADQTVADVRAWLADGGAPAHHQGFPVVNGGGALVGVVTRRDLVGEGGADGLRVRDLLRRGPAVIFGDNTLRQAADHMVREGVGRLVVVAREDPTRVTGIVTRSDLLRAHARRLRDKDRVERSFGRTT